MRDLIALIEWGFKNEDAFVMQHDSDSAEDRMFKKWMLRAVSLFRAKLAVRKAKHAQLENPSSPKARKDVIACVKKEEEVQTELMDAVRQARRATSKG